MFLSLILGDAVDVKLIKPTIMNIAAALFGLVRFPDPLPMGRSQAGNLTRLNCALTLSIGEQVCNREPPARESFLLTSFDQTPRCNLRPVTLREGDKTQDLIFNVVQAFFLVIIWFLALFSPHKLGV